MDEEELNGINFKNKDVMYISSRSTSQGTINPSGNIKASFKTNYITSEPNQTSTTTGKMVARAGQDYYTQTRDKFKTVKKGDDGNWYVGKVRTSPFTGERRSTSRQITEQSAQRKMNRMRKNMDL